MKRTLLIIVLCVVPFAVSAHPGKTDRHGGHKCIKGCEEWGLFYAEYHLHDKYGKPIRIRSEMDKVRPPEVHSTHTGTVAGPDPVTTQTVTVYRTVTEVHEENIFPSNPLLWVLIILLLLFLILRRTRSQSEKT